MKSPVLNNFDRDSLTESQFGYLANNNIKVIIILHLIPHILKYENSFWYMFASVGILQN